MYEPFCMFIFFILWLLPVSGLMYLHPTVVNMVAMWLCWLGGLIHWIILLFQKLPCMVIDVSTKTRVVVPKAWACWLDSWPPQSLSKMLNPKLPRMVRQQRVIVWMVTDPNDQGSHYKQCLRLFFVMIVLFLHFRKLRSDFGDYGKIWQDLALNSHF